ncbi:uncharacterized protein LOC135333746 [Halichondria panicea]|uniref:uncharacterized protein LOC135333746 n=1 Tax=Halichondria panicea TaxID=6063 RepID=UPI00312BB3B7
MEKESCADPDNTTTKRVISENTYDLIERNVVGRVGFIPTVSQSKKTTGRSTIIFVTIIATLALVLAVTILIIDKTSNQPAANTGSLDNTQTQLSASDESIQNQFFQAQLNNLTRAILPAIQAIQSNIDENHREIQDLHTHQSKKIQDLKNDTFRDIEAIRTQQDSTNREIQYLQSQHNDTDQKMVQANGNNSEDTQCLGFDHSHPAPSCQQILDCSPSISSGHFWLGTEENVVLMFCDMNRTCGGMSGGWLRLIALDMRDENPPCPGNLMLIEESGKRLCTGNSGSSAFIEANVQYNMVCGRAIAYQYGALTSFYTTQHGIDNGYVNGISLIHTVPILASISGHLQELTMNMVLQREKTVRVFREPVLLNHQVL